MSDYQHILAKLPALSRTELKEVRLRASALLSMSTDTSEAEDDWLLYGVGHELISRGMGKLPPTSVLVTLNDYKTYDKQAETLKAFLLHAVEGTGAALHRNERRALGCICARSLAGYITSFSEVSLATMLRYSAKMPQAVDRSFPGYLASGMMRFLLVDRREDDQSISR